MKAHVVIRDTIIHSQNYITDHIGYSHDNVYSAQKVFSFHCCAHISEATVEMKTINGYFFIKINTNEINKLTKKKEKLCYQLIINKKNPDRVLIKIRHNQCFVDLLLMVSIA